MAENKPAYDLVVFGATSFVGKIITQYLFDQHAVEKDIKWAIAGRSEEKLAALKGLLGAESDPLPCIVADASDPESLQQLCAQTKVVLSTVGPYALYGEPLLKACVEAGCDYLDLTGEPQWVREMQSKYSEQAEASGARIVHCCGFDSVPSDLGVFYLQEQSKQDFGEYCDQVRMRVKRIKGGASGGTVASILNLVKQVSGNPALRRTLADPYALCPDGHGFKAYQRNHKTARYEAETGRWIAPFIMAAINERVVHRSNALLDNRYGDRFMYDEAMFTGLHMRGGLNGWLMTLGLGSFMLGAAIPPIRWGMEKYILPKPGEGPSPEAQRKGFYDLRFYGSTPSGKSLEVKVTGDRDPGYGSTAKIIAEAALCMVKDLDPQASPGGFWTPASLFGEKLIQRLEDNAGLTFSKD